MPKREGLAIALKIKMVKIKEISNDKKKFSKQV